VLNFRNDYSPLDFHVKGRKHDFYRAFVDKDDTALEDLTFSSLIAKNEMLKLRSYLEQFTMNFPIVTPRKQ